MAEENLISVKFDDVELGKIDAGIAQILAVVAGKLIGLTPEERKTQGRVAEKTEDWILRVKDYMHQNPNFVMSHIDVDEYNQDFDTRKNLLPRYRQIEQLFSLFDDTMLLLGTDLFHNGISFYKGLRSFAQTDAPGAKVIYEDLQKRFPGRPSKKKNPS
jgi:hypothetical protein